jgi:hypothetical protein
VAAFVQLDLLLLSPCGSLDRRELLAPHFGGRAGNDDPRTPAEVFFARTVADVPRLLRAGVRDSFLAVDDDSILTVLTDCRASAKVLARPGLRMLNASRTTHVEAGPGGATETRRACCE